MNRLLKPVCLMITLALVLSLGALLLPTGVAQAAELHVGSGYPYSKIQDAIDDASPGDTVTVHPGTYVENITIDKSLTLQSSDGAAVTTIDGGGSDVVTISLDNQTVVFGVADGGFTVTNGSNGIYFDSIYNGSNLTLRDNVITGNSSGGIYTDQYVEDGSTVLIDDNEVTDNGDSGIHFSEDIRDSSVTISNNDDISGNSMSGIEIYYITDSSTVLITNNTVTDNHSGDGAIIIDDVGNGGTVTISDNRVVDNPDYGQDGIDVNTCADGVAIVQNNIISGNGEEGIDVDYSYGTITISGNTITGNGVGGGESGGNGIDLDDVDGSTVTINGNNIITGNHGDRIYNARMDGASTYTISGNTVSSNDYDGIHIHVYENSSATISDNIITGNADDGIHVSQVLGGGESSELVISYNTISENLYGVRIFDYSLDEDYLVTISPCNDIFDNSEYGVYNCFHVAEFLGEGMIANGVPNGGCYMVDATGNWWGHASGPGGEGPGDGNYVSEYVEYDPWLEFPCEEECDADFTGSPRKGNAPLTVHFEGESCGDVAVSTWSWEFGDGSTGKGQRTSHTYKRAGRYTVILTYDCSPEGLAVEKELYITVLEPLERTEGEMQYPDLVIRNLYISATQAQPGQEIRVTADVFNQGGLWGSAKIDLLINSAYEQSASVGVAPGTAQPISFTVYKVTPGEYKVDIGGNIGTFYVLEEQAEPESKAAGLLVGGELTQGGIIAIIVIGIIILGGIVVAILFTRPT